MSEAAVALRWLLQQAEPEARRVAVHQIPKVAGSDAADLLLRALGDEDWRVRKEAAGVTPSLEQRDEVVAALVAALEETVNIGLRNAAVEALVAIGPDAVSATIESLSRLDADARKLAVEVLGGVADVRCTAALARALDDEDANVRVTAAEALGSASRAGDDSRDDAIKSLVAVLPTRDTFLKIAALESLARLEARLPWSVFEPYAGDPLLRRYAIAAACGSREPEAVRALALATGDSSFTIAREAIVALGEVVSTGPLDTSLLEVAREALQQTAAGRANARRAARNVEDAVARSCALPILGLLRDPADVTLLGGGLGEEVAQWADLGLRLFGPEAVGPLLSATRDLKPSVRAAALELAASLDGVDPQTIRDVLRNALSDGSPEVLASAVDTLGGVGDAGDLRRVAPMVGHPDERVAAAAAKAAWLLAARHVAAARALLEEQRHEPLALACVLLGAVASVETLHEGEVRVLERALAHDRPGVRRAAVDALAQAGGERAADAVVFALADEEHEVQLAAVRALGKLGMAEPLLGLVLDAREAVLTAAALRALGEANPTRAISAAAPLVLHRDPAIACAALEAVGHLASSAPAAGVVTACEDALRVALGHPDAEVVKLALSLVGGRPESKSMVPIGHCLDHASWQVRRVAAELLGQDKAPAAQALLRGRYEREKNASVRAAIAAAASLRPAENGDRNAATPLPRPKEGT